MSSSGRGDDMPLVNMEKKTTKTSMMFGRSTSCVTNPEVREMGAVVVVAAAGWIRMLKMSLEIVVAMINLFPLLLRPPLWTR